MQCSETGQGELVGREAEEEDRASRQRGGWEDHNPIPPFKGLTMVHWDRTTYDPYHPNARRDCESNFIRQRMGADLALEAGRYPRGTRFGSPEEAQGFLKYQDCGTPTDTRAMHVAGLDLSAEGEF